MTNVNPFSTLISSVMRNATQDGQTEAKLVVEMFKSEITFAREPLFNLLSAKGTDRTTRLRKILFDLSEDYASMSRFEEAYRETDKKSRKASDAYDIEKNARAMKSAEALFLRALTTCYYFREIDKDGNPLVTNVALRSEGRGFAVKLAQPDEHGDPQKIYMSGREAHMAGTKTLNARLGKKEKKETSGATINRNDRGAIFEATATIIRVMNDLDSLTDAEMKAFDNLLVAAITKKLVADGTIVLKEFKEYAKEYLPGVRVA